MNVFNSLLSTLVGALITGSIALYVFRKNRGHARTEKTEKQKEAFRKSIEPLYADLGTLKYRCEQNDVKGVIDQMRLMEERRQRGDYDMPEIPSTMQNDCANMLPMFARLALRLDGPPVQGSTVQSVLIGEVVWHMTTLLQTNLNVVRQQ